MDALKARKKTGRHSGKINLYRHRLWQLIGAILLGWLLLAGAGPIQASEPIFSETTGAGNPFNGVDVGARSAPSFVDIDADGDMDAFIGEEDGNINLYRNSGDLLSPVYTLTTGAGNPFNGVDVGIYSKPSFVDVDGDGDMDAFIGGLSGIRAYENTGDIMAPSFTERTGVNNPFYGADLGIGTVSSFVDIDGDGDMDAFFGDLVGRINFFENTGTPLAPSFTERSAGDNPLNVIVGSFSAPSFADVDGDGDRDAFIGQESGIISFFENTGTVLAPEFTERTGTANPFNGVDVGTYSKPSLVDVDSDGDLDAFIGETEGTINFFENTGDNTRDPIFVPRYGLGNPFDGVIVGAVGTFSSPDLVDVDGDGDMDAFIGEYDGEINYYQNVGTPLRSKFLFTTGEGSNPFHKESVVAHSAPSFVDVDGDGDMDAFIGAADGILTFFKNTGTPLAPVFTLTPYPNNPLEGDQGSYIVPSFVDVDGDGDMDAFLGTSSGYIQFHKNTGTPLAPVFTEMSEADNPFDGVDVGDYSTPSFDDVDNDGDMDALIGELGGNINFFENTGTALAPVFTLVTGDGATLYDVNVGSSSRPSMADLDGDGDKEAIVGEFDGSINYIKNAKMATQRIDLQAGWQIISLFVTPEEALEPMLGNIEDDLVLIKNGAGDVYWPDFGIDQIVNWDIEGGYQMYMSTPRTLSVLGEIIKPTHNPINLNAGWKTVSYMRESSMAIDQALESISGELLLVKDGDGSVYWPAENIVDLATMNPGQGYQIFMTNAAELEYPD